MKMPALFLSFFLFTAVNCFASQYPLPSNNNDLIGEIQYRHSNGGETVVTLAQTYDLGITELELANPHLNLRKGLPAGQLLRIPTGHLIPGNMHKGIVINLPEMRLYVFNENLEEVGTYPVGIGKVGKTIPIKFARVVRKMKNPTLVPPPDIRAFNEKQGIILPKSIPPGPDNPLGQFAIYMTIPTYLIHSTLFPESVGTRASFGCIRMYESDIEDFFPVVSKGMPIQIINSPTKIGWYQNELFMEVYPPLEEHADAFDASLPGMVHMILNRTKKQNVLIDWQAVDYVAQVRDGIPHDVGIKIG